MVSSTELPGPRSFDNRLGVGTRDVCRGAFDLKVFLLCQVSENTSHCLPSF